MRWLGSVDMLPVQVETRDGGGDILLIESGTAGPSTSFGAKDAPNSAQDDYS
jgi:hypothetical protein